MMAVEYRKSIPRYLALRTVGPRWPGIYTSAASPVALRNVEPPRLPTPAWVRVRPILSGICGSDLATVCAKGSPYLSPLTSTPFVFGHEVVGTVTELGARAKGIDVGDRVVLRPVLGCQVRGIDPPCDACNGGQSALCRNVTRGDISAGIQTGYCRDTGGAWSESLVAHPSQLYRVPDGMDDEVAVLTEPFSCALHGVLRAPLDAGRRTVLVMGCGTIGLLTIAAIQAVAQARQIPNPQIVAMAKYPYQREWAERLGAGQVVEYRGGVGQRYRALAEALNAEVLHPEIGKPTVVGGADVTFDCVATSASIDDCFRFTTAGGHIVLVGMPAIPSGVDWTAIWYKELTLHAAYAYGRESFQGRQRDTFDLSLETLQTIGPRLKPIVGEPFALPQYRLALNAALHAGPMRSLKTVFRIGD